MADVQGPPPQLLLLFSLILPPSLSCSHSCVLSLPPTRKASAAFARIDIGTFSTTTLCWMAVFMLSSFIYQCHSQNKLAKARKMRKPPGMLSLKKFGLGNLWVEKVWTQNTCILAIHFRKIHFRKYHGKTLGRTDGHLTWVGARDACASKN